MCLQQGTNQVGYHRWSGIYVRLLVKKTSSSDHALRLCLFTAMNPWHLGLWSQGVYRP